MTTEQSLDRPGLLLARVTIPQHVVLRAFPTETVVLNLETAKYHGLNPVGGRMLEELARHDTIAEAAAIVADEYGQPRDEVENDVCELCLDLERRGLVSIDVTA